MSFRRSVALFALALVIAMSGVLPADAQGRGGRGGGRGGGGFGFGGGEPFTPEAGARDLKSVLFNSAWHMGMLRGQSEPELIATLEYRGEGTVQINGQPCTLDTYVPADPGVLGVAGYRISANYRIPGYRVQIHCTFANGQTYSNVETMSGNYAWDEDIPGAEIIAGEGKATPRPETLEERRIRLWASPHGVVKSAIAAAAGVSTAEAFAQNPAVLLDRQAEAGAKSMTTLSWKGNQAVLTFPVPDVPGAMATATLDEGYLPVSVVVKHGRDTTEFLYGDYEDWNNPLNKIEALYAGTIVERKNGKVMRDLKTIVTEIGQVYVEVPVPDSVRAAETTARN